MILILTETEDPHADEVEARLRQRGCTFIRFNPAEFPARAKVSIHYSTRGQTQCILHTGGHAIDLNGLRGVYNRRPIAPTAHEVIVDEVCRSYVHEECTAYLNAIWNFLPCPWLPASPAVLARAESK